jgi:hypothetical protein
VSVASIREAFAIKKLLQRPKLVINQGTMFGA